MDRSIAAGAVTFDPKSNQKGCHQKGFLAAPGLCHTIRKNSRGWNLFAVIPYRLNTLYAKSSYAPVHLTGLLFFRLLPEAFRLTSNLPLYNKFYA